MSKNKDKSIDDALKGVDFDSLGKITDEIDDNCKKEIKAYEKALKEERIRIENMECPVCSSKEKGYFIQSENNGICGPGYHSYVTQEYYICKRCGVHYSDINKKEINKPLCMGSRWTSLF